MTSKRPSTRLRQAEHVATNSSNTHGYVILADTASAILYARRLLNNGVTTHIDIINEGLDRTNTATLTDLNFVVANTNMALHNLKTERIHFVAPGDNQFVDDDDNLQNDQIINYHVGSGPLGDFIAAYFVPRVGPWFPHSSSTRVNKFVQGYTSTSPLNSVEADVMMYIANKLGLAQTACVVTSKPAILTQHYIFSEKNNDLYQREIFFDAYNTVNQSSNVDIHTHVSNIQFTAGSTSGLYDVSARDSTDTLAVQNAKVIWKLNPYSFLRIATVGGANPNPMMIPAFYRAVISIPNAGRVNLSSLTPGDDLITTHQAFSVHDLNNPPSTPLVWLAQAYTTPEDLSVVTPEGAYADADSDTSLLVVEAVCTKNRRTAVYNLGEDEVVISKNDNNVEAAWMAQFTTMVSCVYEAYTGCTLDTTNMNGSVCTGGICQDSAALRDYGCRESPMVTVLETLGHLYGSPIYPCSGTCTQK